MSDEPFAFTPARIDDHLEKLGLDIRPVLDVSKEQHRITTFYQNVSKRFGGLFGSLVLNRNEAKIETKFTVPARGQANVPTFVLTRRGPVFTIPRRLSVLGTEPDLPALGEVGLEMIETFVEAFPQCRVHRVGLINDYIFDSGQTNSVELVGERFTKIGPTEDVSLRFNKPTDEYNRIFVIQPLRKHRRDPSGKQEFVAFGIKVTVDFNNRQVAKPLTTTQIEQILQAGITFHTREAFEILNEPSA